MVDYLGGAHTTRRPLFGQRIMKISNERYLARMQAIVDERNARLAAQHAKAWRAKYLADKGHAQ